jgi:ATP-dependent DNA helicase RecG
MRAESDSVEFKSILAPDIKKEIVAFANTRGGTIYIGIDDEGQVIGADHPDKVCLRLSSMIHDGIKPDLVTFSEIAIEMIESLPVVKVTIQRGIRRPYYLSDKGMKPAGVYVRLGSASVPASENVIRDLIIETDGTGFENIRNIQQDLTFTAATEDFRKHQIEFGPAQYKTHGLMDADGIYTNLGLLLSDQCQHTIKIAVFKGLEKDEFLTRKEFGGSLFLQLAAAYEFIDLNNRLHSTFEGLTRIDTRDYSESAIRETLLNAVIHRDYAFSGSTLVSIFSDRLEVVSLGGLVPGLEVEDIYEGISQTRNTKLANIFYRLKYIEAYGTGIRKIRKECLAYGVEAVFNITHAVFRVTIPLRGIVKDVASELQEPLNRVLQYVRLHPLTSSKAIQGALGLKPTSCGALLKELENRGFVDRHGSGRTTAYSASRSVSI